MTARENSGKTTVRSLIGCFERNVHITVGPEKQRHFSHEGSHGEMFEINLHAGPGDVTGQC